MDGGGEARQQDMEAYPTLLTPNMGFLSGSEYSTYGHPYNLLHSTPGHQTLTAAAAAGPVGGVYAPSADGMALFPPPSHAPSYPYHYSLASSSEHPLQESHHRLSLTTTPNYLHHHPYHHQGLPHLSYAHGAAAAAPMAAAGAPPLQPDGLGLHHGLLPPSAALAGMHQNLSYPSPGALARQQRASADLLKGKRRRPPFLDPAAGNATDLAADAAGPSVAPAVSSSSADTDAGLAVGRSGPLGGAAQSAPAGMLPGSSGSGGGGGSSGLRDSAAEGAAELAGGAGRCRGGLPVKVAKEERRRKRLLRNRVSAQQARERKRSYMEDLEERCKQLEGANLAMEGEIARLSQENNSLRGHMRQKVKAAIGKSDDGGSGGHPGWPSSTRGRGGGRERGRGRGLTGREGEVSSGMMALGPRGGDEGNDTGDVNTNLDEIFQRRQAQVVVKEEYENMDQTHGGGDKGRERKRTADGEAIQFLPGLPQVSSSEFVTYDANAASFAE